ncbi:MAG TPA: 3'-5' exonuclease [Planctomycetes bacterium]|nr:3'-5' exonuclease [Planctomycetaceae bacterium]HIM30584.1 3'-5' exonuclease [Planctomycetota bacterium]
MNNESIRYLVFDIESVADGDLVSRLRYPDEDLTAREAVARYREELMEKSGSDFVPYTFQLPVSVVIAKVTADFRLVDLVALDEPDCRPHVIAEKFWRGWERYGCPTWVTFNGRTFDMPLMELAAFRFGIATPRWFNMGGKSFENPRNRYNTDAHWDMHDLLTNFGASRFNGGLNLAANILGKPGKMDVEGSMVQDLYDEDKLARINDYCRCDVLDTYFVFLRANVVVGRLSLEDEQLIVQETKDWLASQVDNLPIYAAYLERWGDWPNPWAS